MFLETQLLVDQGWPCLACSVRSSQVIGFRVWLTVQDVMPQKASQMVLESLQGATSSGDELLMAAAAVHTLDFMGGSDAVDSFVRDQLRRFQSHR